MKGVQPHQRPIPLSTFNALGWQVANRGGIGIGRYFAGSGISKPVCAHGFAAAMDYEALARLRNPARLNVFAPDANVDAGALSPWESVVTTLRAVGVTEGMNDAKLSALYYDLLGGWPEGGQMFSWEQWVRALDVVPVDLSPQDWYAALTRGELNLGRLRVIDQEWYGRYMARRGYVKYQTMFGSSYLPAPKARPDMSLGTIVWTGQDVSEVDLEAAKYESWVNQLATYVGLVVSPHAAGLLKDLPAVERSVARFEASAAKAARDARNTQRVEDEVKSALTMAHFKAEIAAASLFLEMDKYTMPVRFAAEQQHAPVVAPYGKSMLYEALYGKNPCKEVALAPAQPCTLAAPPEPVPEVTDSFIDAPAEPVLVLAT